MTSIFEGLKHLRDMADKTLKRPGLTATKTCTPFRHGVVQESEWWGLHLRSLVRRHLFDLVIAPDDAEHIQQLPLVLVYSLHLRKPGQICLSAQAPSATLAAACEGNAALWPRRVVACGVPGCPA